MYKNIKKKKSLEESDSISNSEITPLENTEDKFSPSKAKLIDFYQIYPWHIYLAYQVIQFFKKHESIAMYIGPVFNLLMSSIMFAVILNTIANTISIYLIIFFAFNVLSFVIRCLLNFINLKHCVNYYNLAAAILKLAFIVTLRIILGITYPTYKNILGESLLLLSMMFLFVFFAPIAKYENNTTIMISSFVCYLSL
ncbi:hypothetical protein TUBRATIS_28070 [Tubulinosema ratisbonensis]|uniref:Uncharacterized protein n=1 Tax=Tubulinosema ratisbonensis TaxID=291195 RepID=A0A437AI52_9MICR|nr:hypothetical protein TUBRATIS_28070 [Tubulinosema ratisbonensis]